MDSHNVAALDGQTCCLGAVSAGLLWYDRILPVRRRRTFLELLHKVSHNLLELCAVHSELILKILDRLQQILRQLVPRAWGRR